MQATRIRRLILQLVAVAAILVAFRPLVHAHDDEDSDESSCAVCQHLASPIVLPAAVASPVARVERVGEIVIVPRETILELEKRIPRSRGPPVR